MDFYNSRGRVIFSDTGGATNSLKLGILGDSITEGTGATDISKSYVGLMEKNFSSIENDGIGGSCISNVWADPMCNRWDSMASDLDIVMLFGGVNDFYANAPLGNEDSTTKTQFFGALNTILTGFVDKYPGKTIFAVTPMQFNYSQKTSDDTNTQNLTIYDYADAIINRCNYHSIPVLNLLDVSDMDVAHSAAMKTAVSADGLHPNDAGHKIIYERVMAFINSLIY